MSDDWHLPTRDKLARIRAILDARQKLGAQPADIEGLWDVPGYPELTTNQLLDIAGRTP